MGGKCCNMNTKEKTAKDIMTYIENEVIYLNRCIESEDILLRREKIEK